MARVLPGFFIALVHSFFCISLCAQDGNALVAAGKISGLSSVQLPDDEVRAAACAPASALQDLKWNNIDALIETGGSLWQDRANGRSHYFAPKDGGVGVLFAGALWLGGMSPDLQLKLAALQYRYNGNDYWPGPLTNDGTAEVDPVSCQRWDNFVVSYRADALQHRQYFDCLADPDCDVNEIFPDGYTMPAYFSDYPAHGNTAQGQDYYISPFFDYDGDGNYEPRNGDYPWYDITHDIICSQRLRKDPVPLFGDQNFYWVFNDKGNIHTESGGQAIGMEIRAQAFAFSTNDEVNNMTFYNYVLINQGSQTLQDTYFGTWIDSDIGGHLDDYVGCDVQRGLGYGYNGHAFDSPSTLSLGYGDNPPSVGVDFFEGPYQDEDGVDNPLTTDINVAIDNDGIPYKGIGIGYGDGFIDNERFGMRKFLYHISGSANNGPPEQAVHYYNYLRGFWKNGQRMAYGGNALTPSSGADLSIPADYMFPGDTDPYHFGTSGVDVDPWTEVSSGNPSGDRRFMQSAGPFTLVPGDYNNITVGVVFARAGNGDPFESVELVREADDKAQALFDNCFELISGPDAPDVTVRELENELILMWTNENSLSSNHNEDYILIDPTIPETDASGNLYTEDERSYKFQGYLIYQLANESVSSGDLEDIDLARLIGQCDVKDSVTNIVNYARDAATDEIVGDLKVHGADEGVFHSMRITEDAFALGAKRLINHKTYYFMVIAYGYNNYKNFEYLTGSGQARPFLASRKSVISEIPVIDAIPHMVAPQAAGTIAQSHYGQELALTQIEGSGNGHHFIVMNTESEAQLVQDTTVDEVVYNAGASPVKVKIIDPLRVPVANFELRLATDNQDLNGDSAYWELTNITDDLTYDSKHSISGITEELMIDWGLSVEWSQIFYNDVSTEHFTDFVGATLTLEDTSMPWLFGFPDDDSYTDFNWIRSGSKFTDPVEGDPLEVNYNDYYDGHDLDSAGIPAYFTDAGQSYEVVLDGTWTPYCLVSGSSFDAGLGIWRDKVAPSVKGLTGDITNIMLPKYSSNIRGLNNVDVVMTTDRSKWTRCAVFEEQADSALAEGGVEKLQFRSHSSLDKNGIASGSPGCNESEATQDGTQPVGMSWFPGYALDIGTGERLNMAFGEDSWLVGENGNDMIWNPSPRFVNNTGEVLCGGQHWIYVFKNQRRLDHGESFMPLYDNGNYAYSLRNASGKLTESNQKKIFGACTWVGSALRNPAYEWRSMQDGLIPSNVRIQLRVARPYEKFDVSTNDFEDYSGATNWWNPRYSFSTSGFETITGDASTLTSALDAINIVPNPYYAFSNYESGKLDSRVKITNLPQICTITIYNVNGSLIRQFKKGDPITSLDWDLKNHKNIPIGSGVYIIHIEVPGIGEKILKWFGIMRPIDLDNF